jgi:hypothetical protein
MHIVIVLQAFFFYRIPKLWVAIEEELPTMNTSTPMYCPLHYFIDKIYKKSFDHKTIDKFPQKVDLIINNLTDEV